MKNKLKSRKFWVSLIEELTGIFVLIWGVQTGNDVQIIAGSVISILAVLGYIKAEKEIDISK